MRAFSKQTSEQSPLRSSAAGTILLVIAVFVLPMLGRASSLSDYRSRLESARKDLESVVAAVTSNHENYDIHPFIDRKISDVKKLLPESEKLELRGTTIDTSNGWLRAKLDEFSQQESSTQQILVLKSVSERISSIEDHLDALDKALSSGRTKDEDKQKLAAILAREEYQKPPQKEESLFQRWIREFLEWLESIFPKPDISPAAAEGFKPLSVVIQVVIYGLVIALVAFLIYKFAPLVAERFRTREKKESKSRIILGEHIDASASANDLFAEAERMARAGDLRGAIRKGYIALLCDLADRKVIGLARHKTNRDYLRDVRKQSALFERMKLATGSFERHWYGFRTPHAADWDDFREQYRKAVSEV